MLRSSRPTTCRRQFGYFNQSTQRDPTLGVAYPGLAESYSWAAGLSMMPPQQSLEKAQAAAEKALAIDPNLGTAHHALAWVKYARDWDFPGAETEFHAPSNSTRIMPPLNCGMARIWRRGAVAMNHWRRCGRQNRWTHFRPS